MAASSTAPMTAAAVHPHQGLRMDDLLKSKDPFYVSQATRENAYVGVTKPKVGPARTSATFGNVGRERPFPGISLDMSAQPMPWYDNWKGDKREGCYKLPSYGEINTDHLEVFKN